MRFGDLYPAYVAKAERKQRSEEEVREIILWLTGYTAAQFDALLESEVDVEGFFNDAPSLHEARELITGMICGVRIEEIEEPLMKEIRYLDKLIDELAKGRPMEKILRG